jgi:hypothetical protein
MEKFILDQFRDELTGLNFGTDRLGNTHLLEFLNNAAELPIPKDSVYLRAFTEKNWADINNFQTITCTLTGNPTPMIHIVPPNKTLKLDNIIAATNGRYKGISLIGIFIDDILESFFPIQNEMFYSFNEKVEVKGKLEIKFKPFNRRTKLSIFVHGLER